MVFKTISGKKTPENRGKVILGKANPCNSSQNNFRQGNASKLQNRQYHARQFLVRQIQGIPGKADLDEAFPGISMQDIFRYGNSRQFQEKLFQQGNYKEGNSRQGNFRQLHAM